MAVLAAVTVFAVGVPATASTPTSQATSATAAAASKKPKPVLPIDIVIGRIGIHLRVPLTIPGLLGLDRSSSSTPAPPTSSASTTPSSHPTSPRTRPVTHPHPRTSSVAARSSTGAPPLAAGGGPGVVGDNPGTRSTPVARHTSKAHAHASSSGSSSRHSRHRSSSVVLIKQLFPDTGAAILIALCIVCALGVAVVVRVSGRRGRHLA